MCNNTCALAWDYKKCVSCTSDNLVYRGLCSPLSDLELQQMKEKLQDVLTRFDDVTKKNQVRDFSIWAILARFRTVDYIKCSDSE